MHLLICPGKAIYFLQSCAITYVLAEKCQGSMSC